MNTTGILAATKAKKDVTTKAIEDAMDLLSKERSSGELLTAFVKHREQSERPFLTSAYLLSRTQRPDTGKSVNQRLIYKPNRQRTRADIEEFLTKLEKQLLIDLVKADHKPLTREGELELEIQALKAQLKKCRDHLHVCYAREREHRRAARQAANASPNNVHPFR